MIHIYLDSPLQLRLQTLCKSKVLMRRSGFRDEVDFGSDYFSHGLTCVKPVKLKVSEIKFPIGSGTCTFFASFWLGPTSVLSRTFPWITRISTEGLGEISSAILKYSRVVLKYSAIVVLLCFVKKPLTRLACIAEGGPIASSLSSHFRLSRDWPGDGCFCFKSCTIHRKYYELREIFRLFLDGDIQTLHYKKVKCIAMHTSPWRRPFSVNHVRALGKGFLQTSEKYCEFLGQTGKSF